MGDIGVEELMNLEQMQGTDNGKEEKILVLVRLRPLNEKEIAHGEVAEWECINSTTILYRNSLQERSGLPTAYSFDKVFRGDCTTREVYQAGTKDIALAVVGGINSTIFAYGQTSSGKTYTMNGVTEYAVADIYDYVQRHEERAFALKFSAMEIYNEVVRDLLSMDNTPLRLLDDPERGTVIEKLTEETLRDQNHLKGLLCLCEAQRQIGETSLNETSSRSHQILRLTVESSAREFLGKSKSTTLAASVNFVDLAGSERASQASSVGQRLKEGCHINRSLLTLGTVIRKLSKGRHGHVNYRDSKLTRILQPTLGGNARTAIICTLCPARNHIEQSRNTLLFASCAKEVSTNARVNIVMSDKALVKHLQKEVARLEGELRTPGSICDHAPMLRKKDMQIEQMENEVKELKKQLSFAHTRIEDLIRATESHKSSQKSNETLAVNGDFWSNGTLGQPISQENGNHYSSDVTSDPNQGIGEIPVGINEDCDDICKEVRCIEMDESGKERYESFGTSTHEEEEIPQTWMNNGNDHISELPRQMSDAENGNSNSTQDQRNQDVPKTINTPVRPCWDAPSPYTPSSGMVESGGFRLSRSQSCRANIMISSPDSEMAEQKEHTPSSTYEKNFPGRPESGFLLRKQWKLTPVTYGANTANPTGSDSPFSDCSSIVDEMRNQNTIDTDEEIPTLGSFVAGLRETAKLQRASRAMDQVKETQRRDDNIGTEMMAVDSMNDWSVKFAMLQKSIVELWHDCYVSLIHRTYFVLLVKDDFSDSIYMEVEYRRLSFLKDKFSRGNSTVQDGGALTLAASSKKALRREREMLSRLMHKRYTSGERNRLYNKWGISLNSKQRRLQLVHLLWSDPKNMDNMRESTAIVAKLIGFSEHGQAPKEMFGLSFVPPTRSRRSFSWKNSMPSLI